MKALVVEDDFTSRLLLQKLLAKFGEAHVAVNGTEALDAFKAAINAKEPYHLVCLDITIPEMDGLNVLKELRAYERSKGILSGDGAKVIMTTASKDKKNIFSAFEEQCEAYLNKPISHDSLVAQLKKLGLIPA